MASKLAELRARLPKVPLDPGVYIMRDRLGHVIYVGKAKQLRKRLRSYFLPSQKQRANLKTRALIDSIWDFQTHTVRNEEEALALETKLIKDYRPRYNVQFKDDKRHYMVKINLNDEFPFFQLTRLKKNDQFKYFGPFVHSNAIRATIDWINREFGLWARPPKPTDSTSAKRTDAALNDIYGATYVGEITREEYLDRVNDACRLLSGVGRRDKLKQLRAEMQRAAESLDFEKAAELRDICDNLEKTTAPTRLFRNATAIPSTIDPTEDLASLGEYLNLPAPPKIMECFDISNVSATHIVASMVRFIDGRPDNGGYRRYRIKTVEGQDDFASMAEVVRRRYARIIAENAKEHPDAYDTQAPLVETLYRLREQASSATPLPDLVIVDGGKGQLSAAYAQIRQLQLHELPIVGLAKQFEEVYFPNQKTPLRIDHNEGALKMLQRIRDEAHRFANLYNELLLKKRMRASLLDSCPGMTATRKSAILKKFGSVNKLKQATLPQILNTPGIGPKTAEELFQFLANNA